MQKIICYDKDGNTLDHLVQWDKNQSVYTDPIVIEGVFVVHFSESEDAENAYEYPYAFSVLDDGRIKIDVPNHYLTKQGTIYIYLYDVLGGETEPRTTVYFMKVNIKKKAKPINYIYDDSIEYLTLSNLWEKIDNLESEVSSLKTRVETLEAK